MTAADESCQHPEIIEAFDKVGGLLASARWHYLADQDGQGGRLSDATFAHSQPAAVLRGLVETGEQAWLHIDRLLASEADDEVRSCIGPGIRRLRSRAGINQEEVETYLGLTRTLLSKYENQHRIPSAMEARRICQLLLRVADPDAPLGAHDETRHDPDRPVLKLFGDLRTQVEKLRRDVHRLPRRDLGDLRTQTMKALHEADELDTATLELLLTLIRDPSLANTLAEWVVGDPLQDLRERLTDTGSLTPPASRKRPPQTDPPDTPVQAPDDAGADA